MCQCITPRHPYTPQFSQRSNRQERFRALWNCMPQTILVVQISSRNPYLLMKKDSQVFLRQKSPLCYKTSLYQSQCPSKISVAAAWIAIYATIHTFQPSSTGQTIMETNTSHRSMLYALSLISKETIMLWREMHQKTSINHNWAISRQECKKCKSSSLKASNLLRLHSSTIWRTRPLFCA